MGFNELDRRQLFPPDLLGHGNSRKEIQFVHAISGRNMSLARESQCGAGALARGV